MNTSGKKNIIKEELALPNVVMELDAEYFTFPWSKAQWEGNDFVLNKLYTWRNEDLIKGFVLLQMIPGDTTAHLLKICLRKEFQGTGESLLFWRELEVMFKQVQMTSIFLEVELTNKRAIGFYHKLGFKNLRLIKNFYSSGESAQTMLLTL